MRYIYLLPAAFLAPVIHEWVKALVSTALGDPTPKKQGYLTANPFRYFEPIGFIFILLYGFGWGRPVPTGALHYRDRKLGVILTYTVPVIVNLLLGIFSVAVVNLLVIRIYGPLRYDMFVIFLHFHLWTLDPSHLAIILLSHFAFININLALFNLLPVYPLAANKLLVTFSNPENIARINHYEKIMQVGMVILLAFGFIPSVLLPFTHQIIRWSWGLLA